MFIIGTNYWQLLASAGGAGAKPTHWAAFKLLSALKAFLCFLCRTDKTHFHFRGDQNSLESLCLYIYILLKQETITRYFFHSIIIRVDSVDSCSFFSYLCRRISLLG